MLRTFSHQLENQLATASVPRETRILMEQEKVKLAALAVPPNIEPGTQRRIRKAVDNSFVFAFRLVMLLSAALGCAGGLGAWLILEENSLHAKQTRID